MTWKVEIGSRVRPFGDLTASGDAVFTWSDGDRGLYAVIDALGHGIDAEKSALRVKTILAHYVGMDLSRLFARVHAEMQGMRGVVMSAIHIDRETISFAGVGNVELVGRADVPGPPCMPGVIGGGRLHLHVAPLQVADGARWGLISDGIRQRDVRAAWDDAAALRPFEAAQKVLERAGRSEDDASVLVLDFAKVVSA